MQNDLLFFPSGLAPLRRAKPERKKRLGEMALYPRRQPRRPCPDNQAKKSRFKPRAQRMGDLDVALFSLDCCHAPIVEGAHTGRHLADIVSPVWELRQAAKPACGWMSPSGRQKMPRVIEASSWASTSQYCASPAHLIPAVKAVKPPCCLDCFANALGRGRSGWKRCHFAGR